MKVTKETRELNQEQYDLDTGEVRTWVETKEYEVMEVMDTSVRAARTGSITHVDLTEEAEEPVMEHERKPLDDLRNRGVRGGSKLSNSTSNLSLETSSIRCQDRSFSTPLLSKSGKETFDDISRTFESSLLLGESLTKRHRLSSSKACAFETEVDGVIVDLKESYVKLTNCGDKPEKCDPVVVKEKTIHVLAVDSSDLPEGWTRFRRARLTGGRYIHDTFIQNPEGKKFDRQKQIDQFLKKIKSNLKIRFRTPTTFNTKKGSSVSLNETSSLGSLDLELMPSSLSSVGTKVEEIRRSRRNSFRI